MRLDTVTAVDLFIEKKLDFGGSPATAKTYRAVLLDFERQLELENIVRATSRDIVRYNTRLSLKGRAPSTKRMRFHALCSFFGFLKQQGYIDVDPTKGISPPRDPRLWRLPVFTAPEIDRLCFLPSEALALRRGRREPEKFFQHRADLARITPVRDSVVIALLVTVGLRAGEFALLGRDAYDEKTGVLMVHGEKRAKELVPYELLPFVRDLMAVYLIELWRSPWARHPSLFPPLVPMKERVRTHPGDGITPDVVERILRRRIAYVGLEVRGRRLSPHAARYTLATLGKEGGASTEDLQAALRHQSPVTTLRYINRGSFGKVQRRVNRSLPWSRRRLAMAPSEPVAPR